MAQKSSSKFVKMNSINYQPFVRLAVRSNSRNLIRINRTILASHDNFIMRTTRLEIQKSNMFSLPFDEGPRRTKFLTAFGWFAILGLVAAVIGATLAFTV